MFVAVAVSPVLAFDPASVNGANYDEKSAANGSSAKEPNTSVDLPPPPFLDAIVRTFISGFAERCGAGLKSHQ
jgi:hypothetical protein